MFQAVKAAMLLVVVGLLGCSAEEKAGPAGLVPVSGTVTLDGKPVEGATVTFIPTKTEGSSDAGAVTDASGKYELRAGEGSSSGALPGEYRVIISRLAKADGSTVMPDKDRSPMQLMLEDGAKETIPPKYSDMIGTTLKATVPAGGGTQDFKLESK